MKIIYLYDEFMRVPDNIEGQPIYIFDSNLQKNYQISDKIIEYRYFLAEQAGATIYQGETLRDYLVKVAKQESELSFTPDDDNIIPILDDEWFEDDIVGRFHEFLRASFGDQNFEKNVSFVEESIGKDIRKYFVKDFYKDHIQRYKKRPIYWMFSSPKGSFNVLVYMHRYTPDTLNQILNGYLNEHREKLKTRMETLDHLMISGSPSEHAGVSEVKVASTSKIAVTSGGWEAGSYEFCHSVIDLQNNETLPQSPQSSLFPITTGAYFTNVGFMIKDGSFSGRKNEKGVRIYTRKKDGNGRWILFLDVDYQRGVRSNLFEEYTAFTDGQGTGTNFAKDPKS